MSASDGQVHLKPFATAAFSSVTAVAKLPPAMREALKDVPMADAGQPFNVGCVVDSQHPLPFARLIFAAVSPDLCIVHYEQGGIAHFFKVVAYDLSPAGKGEGAGKARLLWSANLNREKVNDLAELNKLIESGQLQAFAPDKKVGL